MRILDISICQLDKCEHRKARSRLFAIARDPRSSSFFSYYWFGSALDFNWLSERSSFFESHVSRMFRSFLASRLLFAGRTRDGAAGYLSSTKLRGRIPRCTWPYRCSRIIYADVTYTPRRGRWETALDGNHEFKG